jgi:hypothetical protein
LSYLIGQKSEKTGEACLSVAEAKKLEKKFLALNQLDPNAYNTAQLACIWYLSVDSRLCHEDCSTAYYAHFLSDRTARVVSGKRFLLWLQRTQPAIYRLIPGGSGKAESRCRNPKCRKGEQGQPASLAHLRAGSRFCCDGCRMQALRSPRRGFSPAKRAVFIEDSRYTSGE